VKSATGSQESESSDEQAMGAVAAFWLTGALPQDDLHLEALLVSVEFEILVQHKRGKDVAEAMALLDKVARGREKQQEAALRMVCEMAANQHR
jgi:hypothetical protein